MSEIESTGGAMSTAQHASYTSIAATEATEGGVAGFAVTCEACGLQIAYSLRTMVFAEMTAHEAWHQRRFARRQREARYAAVGALMTALREV